MRLTFKRRLTAVSTTAFILFTFAFFACLSLGANEPASPGTSSIQRIESHMAAIQDRKAASERMFGSENSTALMRDSFVRNGVKNLDKSPAKEWGGWFWMFWKDYKKSFYDSHWNELDKALNDARADALKPEDLARLNSGMQRWLKKEVDLQKLFRELLDNWGKGCAAGERRSEEGERLWAKFAPEGGSITRRVQEALAPLDAEIKGIEKEGEAIKKRIEALGNLKIFSYDRNEEYGH